MSTDKRAWCAAWPAIILTVPAWLAVADSAGPPCGSRPVGKYVLEPRILSRIPPGTPIGDRPPAGWTHLILKSQSRLVQGDLDKIPATTARLSTLFFTAIVANVRAERAGGRIQYSLDRVAIGLGTRVKDKDPIVSSQTEAAKGANLGFLAGLVLSQAEARLDEVRQVARSRTMAIVDAPTAAVVQGRHVPAVLRYAVVVDPATGRLTTFAWLIALDESGRRSLLAGSSRRLRPNLVATCDLDVDAKEFFAGVPSDKAFAVLSSPPGTAVAVPPNLREAAIGGRFSLESVELLDGWLRAASK
ncbi:MAG: hypothetical protein ACYC35_18380 [Pirellulales bacterium]